MAFDTINGGIIITNKIIKNNSKIKFVIVQVFLSMKSCLVLQTEANDKEWGQTLTPHNII